MAKTHLYERLSIHGLLIESVKDYIIRMLNDWYLIEEMEKGKD